MKLPRNIFKFFLVILLMTSCSSVREGLEGKKIREGEEFLIQKKNPLVLPPDFDKLPLPKNANNDESNNVEIEEDIEKLLQVNSEKKKTSTEENNSTSLEESILEKIK
tara:strand:- start:2996 stop:3319 length:324 start_codon:yes stop_codon:yes gene_type:complete